MAWSVIGSLGYDVVAGTSNSSETLPGTLAEGDIVLNALTCDTVDGGVTAGQSYNILLAIDGGAVLAAEAAYKLMGSTPDSIIQIKQNQFRKQAGTVQVWRGVDQTTPIDNSLNFAESSSGSPDAPAHETLTDGALRIIIGFLDDDDSAAAATAPSGYTNVVKADTEQASTSAGATTIIASKEAVTAGSENPAAFTGMDDAWRAIHFALRPAEEEEEAAEVDVTDDLFVALAEESTLSATLAREDDLTVAVSEEAAILASLARMDSVSTLLAEAAAILVPRSGEDTLAAFLADMSAIAAAISAADDLGLLLTETSVLAVMLARQDSAIVALDEVVTIQAALNRADDLGIALSEAVTILAALLRSDTLHAALGELASLSIAASVEDALSPYLVELADLEILTVAIAAADTLAPYVVDVASLAVLLGRVDALHVQIDDVSDIAAFVNRLDALGVALSEAVQILATVTRTDELAVTLDDVATILGILAVLDEIAVFFTEASDVDAFDVVAKNVSDALGLTLAEASAVAIVLGREDSLGVHVSDEILSILVSLHRFDPILLNPAFDRARLFAGLADSLRRYEVPREFRSFAVERENRVLEIERDD